MRKEQRLVGSERCGQRPVDRGGVVGAAVSGGPVAAHIDHLIVNNAGAGARAGGLQLNYVLSSEIFAVADAAGGAAGIALEQTQISRISGAGSAAAKGGAALLIENGYSFANTIDAMASGRTVRRGRQQAHNENNLDENSGSGPCCFLSAQSCPVGRAKRALSGRLP